MEGGGVGVRGNSYIFIRGIECYRIKRIEISIHKGTKICAVG